MLLSSSSDAVVTHCDDYFWLHILKAPPPCQSIPNNDCNDSEIDGNKIGI